MKKIIISILLLLLFACLRNLKEDNNIEINKTDFEIEYAGFHNGNIIDKYNNLTIDQAYIILKNSERFTLNGIGYGADIPDEFFAFRKIFFSKNSKSIFIKLEKEANNIGKLYSLCGLYFTNKKLYKNLIKKYLEIDDKICFQEGCCSFSIPMNVLIRSNFGYKDFCNEKLPKALRYSIDVNFGDYHIEEGMPPVSMITLY